MTKIRKFRLDTLKRWYPDELRSPDDWVHKTCLAHLGLHPFPRGRINFERVMGQAVLKRMREIISQHTDVRGARQLIQVVYQQLCNEYNVPTDEGRKQMRYMVSHWITTKMGDERGGVAVAADNQGTVTLASTDIIEDIDNAFTLENATAESAQHSGTATRSLDMNILLQAPAEKLNAFSAACNAIVNIEIQRANAERERANAERERANAERERANADDKRAIAVREEHETGVARRNLKRQAPVAEHAAPAKRRLRLDASGPHQLRDRQSISHWVLQQLNADEVPLERIFNWVFQWFQERSRNVSKCTLDTVIKYIEDTPVVYGWPATYRRAFFGTRFEQQLLEHVRQQLAPEPPAVDDRESVSTDTSVGDVEPAPIFRRPSLDTVPTELGPISMDQQAGDIERLCRLCNVLNKDWPAAPDERYAAAALEPSFLRRWVQIPPTKSMRIGQWLTRLQWQPPVDTGLYLLAAVMSRLDGWRWPMGRGYPKTSASSVHHDALPPPAVHHLRRALVATRGVTATHPCHTSLTAALGMHR